MPRRRPSPRRSPVPPRLRVLEALRSGLRTVNDLAARLGVTDNAIRGHLAALEREGLVQAAGVVHSGVAGKPALEYEPTLDAEIALSRAYAPALQALVEALAERLEPAALQAALGDAGRRLAPDGPRPPSLAAGAQVASNLLTGLGGSVRVDVGRGHADLRGDGCPLAAAVAKVPATCTIVEAMLEARSGRRVEQHCEHGDRPRCAFRMFATDPR